MAKVIVYTCAYNAEKTISRTIESVLSQTFGDFKYYIVNNGSTDATGSIIDAYCSADKRICRLNIFENNFRYYGSMFALLRHASMDSAEWATIIDADDTWTVDFLENMTSFAEENNLPFVMCGYEQIEDKTGKLLKQKTLENNLIVKREDYAEQFVNYRGFTLAMWGKLFPLKFNVMRKYHIEKQFMYGDSNSVLNGWTTKFDTFGIYAKPMYKYHIHESAYTLNNVGAVVGTFHNLYTTAKSFLENFGEISNYNQNFLYAIYLTAVKDTVNLVVSSSLSQPQKLVYIKNILQKPLLYEIFEYRDVNPEIINMVNRREVLCGIMETIKSMDNKGYPVLHKDICAIYDSLIESLENTEGGKYENN